MWQEIRPIFFTSKPSQVEDAIQREIFKIEVEYANWSVTVIDYSQPIATVIPKKIPKGETVRLMTSGTLFFKRDYLKYSDGIDKDSYRPELMQGRCVYRLMVKHYGGRFTEDELFSCFREYARREDRNAEFTKDTGVSPKMVEFFCRRNDLSVIGLNVHNKVIVHHKGAKNWGRGKIQKLCFYYADNHMFLINDEQTIKSIVAAERRLNDTATMRVPFKLEAKAKDDYDSCPEMTWKDAIKQWKAGQLTSGNVFITKADGTPEDLTRKVMELMVKERQAFRTRGSSNKITSVRLNDDLTLTVLNAYAETGADPRDIREACKNLDISFQNQGFGTMLYQAMQNYFKKGIRRTLNAAEKGNILESQRHLCAICNESLEQVETHYDHKVCMAISANNELDNFHAICESCHREKTESEIQSGFFAKYDPTVSNFNEEVFEQITSHLAKRWAFVESVNQDTTDPIHKLDLVKCRRSIVMNCQEQWAAFSVMDNIEIYSNGPFKPGIFFVETVNKYPFRGNGWYSHVLARFGIEQDLIKREDVKFQCLASSVLKGQFFRPFFEHLLKNVDKKLGKIAINAIIGMWGARNISSTKTFFTVDADEAGTHQQQGAHVKVHQIGTDELFEVCYTNQVTRDALHLPLYLQVIDMEAIELYKLEQKLKSKGAIIVDRNTDAISYSSPKPIDLQETWEVTGTKKYQVEEYKPLRATKLQGLCRDGTISPIEREWKIHSDPGNNNFKKWARTLLSMNESMFITGSAGCGKTTLVKELLNRIPSDEVVKLAPTNVSARLIGGMTLHRFGISLALSNLSGGDRVKRLKDKKFIFIDEISMVPHTFYRLFNLIKMHLPHIKFIISGDFKQFPPVADREKYDYQGSDCFYDLCDGNRVELSKVRRVDSKSQDLAYLCQNPYKVDIKRFKPKKNPNKVNLCFTHQKRKEVNRECMEHFNNPKLKTLTIPEDPKKPKSQTVHLQKHTPLIAIKNNRKLNLFNSETYTIQKVTATHLTAKHDHSENIITIEASQFHHLFHIGYAWTIHKSQGKTIDRFTVHQWNSLDKTAKYVTLSRGTSTRGISIVP